MLYKLSFYNLTVIDRPNEIFIWNLRRGSIIRLEKELLSQIEMGQYDLIDKAVISQLVKCGVIVPSDLNEYEELVFSAKQHQYDNKQDSLGMVITPTLACNYNCPYCFEHDRKKQDLYMSQEVCQKIVAAVKKHIETSVYLQKIRITWFGGEPLLAYNKVIIPLQSELAALGKIYNKEISFSIITNGFYLTPDKFDFLFKEKFTKFVQITFDGTEQEYSIRKGVPKSAYSKVVNNILDLSDYIYQNNLKVQIKIRLNVDNRNYNSIKEFVNNIKSNVRYHDNLKFALGRLIGYDFCEDFTDFCCSQEFENLLMNFDDFLGKKPTIIEPKLTFCGQHCVNVVCVGTNGELYKCEHDFGCLGHTVGTIDTGINYNNYFNEFMNQDLPPKCKQCKILPICMGGCPHRRLQRKQQIECEHSIDNLIRKAKKYILNRR